VSESCLVITRETESGEHKHVSLIDRGKKLLYYPDRSGKTGVKPVPDLFVFWDGIMGVICDICGEEFKDTRGLAGHKQFKHDGEDKPPAGKAITRALPLDNVIENLRLPQVPEAYNGHHNVYVAGFNDGVLHGARSILAGIRAAQELSSVGVQQAVPLIKMAQEMRQAEGQAAQTLAAQFGQINMQSNQQIINAIHDLAQGYQSSETNPLAATALSAIQPFLGQFLTQAVAGVTRQQPGTYPQNGQQAFPTGQPVQTDAYVNAPPSCMRPGEQDEFMEV
jgi:hypothetical protein